MKANMQWLSYPLPEDILKRKWSGDLEGAERVIRDRLAQPLPQALRNRLELELETLPLLRGSYTVSEAAAQQLLTEKLRDFQPEELAQWRDADYIDWMLVDGELHYIDSFYDNLIATRPEIAARRRELPQTAGKTSAELRKEAIDLMQREGQVCARLRLRASIRLTRPEAGQSVRAWLPLPVVADQITAVRLLASSQSPAYISGETYPQRTVYFEGTAGETDTYWIEYELESRTPYFAPDPARVSAQQPCFYTHEQGPHIVFTPYLRELTAEIVGQEPNPLRKARRIYDFITTQVKYSYMRPYAALPIIPEYCASRLRGDCGVQALTFITMCRIAGIPAKWQSGLHADSTGAGCHDWAMFYVAPYGWMFCDPSFGGGSWRAAQNGDPAGLERWNHYFGNLDPYRVVLATEFQAPYDPPMIHSRRDPYDNQDGEIEYVSRPIFRPEQERKVTCLSAEIHG